jgi:hypothetical protein
MAFGQSLYPFKRNFWALYGKGPYTGKTSIRNARREIVDALLTGVADFSGTAVWVVGSLFALEFVAIFIYVYRTGTVDKDKEEGSIVTRGTRVSGGPLRGSPLIAGGYWSKSKMLLTRSGYISEMSLVDGTATKAERLIVDGLKLAFLLFWLAWAFGILTLLPSEPGVALTVFLIWSCLLWCGVNMIRKSRADAQRKFVEKQAQDKHR